MEGAAGRASATAAGPRISPDCNRLSQPPQVSLAHLSLARVALSLYSVCHSTKPGLSASRRARTGPDLRHRIPRGARPCRSGSGCEFCGLAGTGWLAHAGPACSPEAISTPPPACARCSKATSWSPSGPYDLTAPATLGGRVLSCDSSRADQQWSMPALLDVDPLGTERENTGARRDSSPGPRLPMAGPWEAC